MKQGVVLLVIVLLATIVYLQQTPTSQHPTADGAPAARAGTALPVQVGQTPEAAPERGVLDITVHTIEELEVVLERAEQLAMKPRAGGGDASVVLVLHGPEVEFFSIRNYDQYKEIVDRAARLDAFDVVDVKICQTMMGEYGIEPEDIPSFIEQVPYGPDEIERLVREGYVYF